MYHEMIEKEELTTDVNLDTFSTKELPEYFPMIYGRRRDGRIFTRKCGKASIGSILESFVEQDKLKNAYRDAEQNGQFNPCFGIKTGTYTLIFSKELSDWMLTNSEIAILVRHNWQVIVI